MTVDEWITSFARGEQKGVPSNCVAADLIDTAWRKFGIKLVWDHFGSLYRPYCDHCDDQQFIRDRNKARPMQRPPLVAFMHRVGCSLFAAMGERDLNPDSVRLRRDGDSVFFMLAFGEYAVDRVVCETLCKTQDEIDRAIATGLDEAVAFFAKMKQTFGE